jgi:hypothetical protein
MSGTSLDDAALAGIVNTVALENVRQALAQSTTLARNGVPVGLAVAMMRDALLAAAIAHHRSAAMAGHVPADDAVIRRAFEHCLSLPQVLREVAADGSLGPEHKIN